MSKYREFNINLYQKRKKNSIFKKLFVIFVVLVLMFFSICFADLMSNALTAGKFEFSIFNGVTSSNVSAKEKVYYALLFGKFESEEEALLKSNEANTLGAGAYIYKTDKYNLIAQIYENKADASKVAKEIEVINFNVEIMEIKCNKINLNLTYESNNLKNLNNALKIFTTTASALYDNCVNLDLKKINLTACCLNINKLKGEVKNLETKLLLILSNEHNEKVSQIKNSLTKLSVLLDDLTVNMLTNNQTYILKYAIIETVCIYKELCKNL